jgi:hypothetical protein
VTTPKFSKGDRVKLSADGLAKLSQPRNPNAAYFPEKRGKIEQVTRSGTGFYVLWDGKRAIDPLHGNYLERAEEQ